MATDAVAAFLKQARRSVAEVMVENADNRCSDTILIGAELSTTDIKSGNLTFSQTLRRRRSLFLQSQSSANCC